MVEPKRKSGNNSLGVTSEVLIIYMSGKIAFRKVTPTDREFLLALRKASMNEHLILAGLNLTDAEHYVRIDEHYFDSHIILCDENAIGVLKLGAFVYHIHIRQFQLLPNYHGLGIGGNILNMLKKKAFESNRVITLNVLLANPAKRLYLRHGFVIIEENALEYKMRWQAS